MKMAAHNNSNPTLLVSEIPEQTSQHQETMILGNCNETIDKSKVTCSLLPPQVRSDYIQYETHKE